MCIRDRVGGDADDHAHQQTYSGRAPDPPGEPGEQGGGPGSEHQVNGCLLYTSMPGSKHSRCRGIPSCSAAWSRSRKKPLVRMKTSPPSPPGSMTTQPQSDPAATWSISSPKPVTSLKMCIRDRGLGAQGGVYLAGRAGNHHHRHAGKPAAGEFHIAVNPFPGVFQCGEDGFHLNFHGTDNACLLYTSRCV